MSGLYLHVPFRRAEVSHDDAYVTAPPTPETDALADALSQEAVLYAARPSGQEKVESLYVGGGRPSLLSLNAFRGLDERLRGTLPLSALEEWTLEAHPVDATETYLSGLRDIGVTRISLDVLSFAPDDLDHLGTTFTVEEAVRAIRRVQDLDVLSISVDLAFWGAEHPPSNWENTLQRVVDLGVPHVTLHEVHRRGSQQDQEARRNRFAAAMRFLRAAGYTQYELTHFARPDHRSLHLDHTYAHGNVLGLGPSAESFWWPDRSTPTGAERWTNVANLQPYRNRVERGERPIGHEESLDRRTLGEEYVLLRLRTKDGLDLSLLNDRYGLNLRDRHVALLDRLDQEGLIQKSAHHLRLTDRGLLLADAITERLLRS